MTADCGISIGAKILEYLVEPVLIRPLRPIFCFKSIVHEFYTESGTLLAKKARVENALSQARNRVHEMDKDIDSWLRITIQIMENDQILQRKLERRRSCFSATTVEENGQVERNMSHCCSLGWTCRYQLSKQVIKHTDTIKKHYAKLDESRDLLSHPIDLRQRKELPQQFVFSESASSALHAVVEALVDERVNKIGLYSAGGAGRTTLAMLVFKEVERFNIFHPIMVSVPQNQETTLMIRTIQGTISDCLRLPLEQEGEEGRASKLRCRLGNGQRILIILDDVLEELDLGRVGIPSSGPCKVLLTTNDLHVCNSMNTEPDIHLGPLSEDEAWGLFKHIADVDDVVRADVMTKKVVSFCNGLPKALVTVGRALRGTEHSSWEVRLQHLKDDQLKEVFYLQHEIEKLSMRKESVQKEVEMARNNAQEIKKEVEAWLANAKTVMKDSEKLVGDAKENDRYFGEWHKVISKQALELTTIVKSLLQDGTFGQVAHPAPPIRQYMGLSSSEDFMISKSAESAFHKIMDALVKEDVYKIGLYGMGGVGKTTLAKHVLEEAERSKIFDRAVMVTVSQTPEVRKIQGVIADFLGLKLDQESDQGRASRLKDRLKDEKILIILDDVWEEFNLPDIGIFSGECKGCKILLTTRRLYVCNSMRCQMTIESELLSEDEAWCFFKKTTGLHEESKLNGVAKEIVGECKGLPLALAAVGLSLRQKKSDDHWIEALEKLKSSRLVEIPDVDKNAYKCLQLSYDYMKDSADQAQFLFLLCSLFPEDYEIDMEDLTRCAFGMGLFTRVSSVQDARRKVHVALQFIKDSGLLLGTDEKECVKMHDVVRDVALWIGGKERSVVAIRDGTDLKELMKNKSFLDYRAISFMSDSLSELSGHDGLEFPKLETMLIFGGREDFGLSDTFFEHMKTIKVLDIRSTDKWYPPKFSVPQSLEYLTDLQMLNLGSCQCYNSHVIGELTDLKVLSIACSDIHCKLEAVLMKMKKLRLLDLTWCRFHGDQLPSNVIKDMIELEELYTVGASNVIKDMIELEELYTVGASSSKDWYETKRASSDDGESKEWRWLSEVNSLQKFVRFSAYIDEACLPDDFCFPNVEFYNIVIGVKYDKRTGYGKVVVLNEFEDRSHLNAFRKLLPTVEHLELNWLILGKDFKNIIPCWVDVSGFADPKRFLQNLKQLCVYQCEELEALFELEVNHSNYEPQHIWELEILTVSYLPELKHIWKGSTKFVSLCNLTRVEIVDCPKLKYIFSSVVCISSSLQQLEVLSIDGCDALEEVFDAGAHDGDFSGCFQNLRELNVWSCDKLKAILPIMSHPRFHLPKLLKIILVGNPELEHVFGQYQIVAEAEQCCPSLQELVGEGCPKLSTQFFTNIVRAPSTAKQLRKIHLHDIQGVEEIMQLQSEEGDDQVLCFDLQEFVLNNIKDLKCIWSGAKQNIHFSHLTEVYIGDCNNLKHLFTATIASSLKQLRSLSVYDCHALQQIITVGDQIEDASDDHIDQSDTDLITFPKLERLTLDNLPSLIRFCPVTYHLVLPCLQGLFVRLVCPKLFVHFVANILQAPSTSKQLIYICFSNKERVQEIMPSKRKNENYPFMMFHLQEMEWDNIEDLWSGTKQNTCFSYLTKLSVSDCNSLKQLFTLAMASSLVQLEELHVKRCNELEQIISLEERKENVTDNDHIDQSNTISLTFPKLERIKLENLASLIRFCPATCHLVFPCLNVLEVSDCPEQFAYFVTNILQALTTAKQLRNIHLQNMKGVEEIMHLQREEENDPLLTFQLETLILENMDDLKCIWGGTKHNICFSHLTELDVSGCNGLKRLFTTSVALTLEKLQVLRVERCDELEQIIYVGDQVQEKEKENVGERECRFKRRRWKRFPSLTFPSLQRLECRDLPSLTSFKPYGYRVLMPRMTNDGFNVKGCPKMKSHDIIEFWS